MRFERKGDLRETIHIGRIGNPIQISAIHEPNPESLQKIRENPRMNNEEELHILTSKLSEISTSIILKDIEAKQIKEGWEERYYVSYWDGEEIVSNAVRTTELHFKLIGEFSGEYLEFGEKKYLIP